jgi:LacI family transcriptional regulator
VARRVTIEDVAKAAGVSPATVDRVLNGRQRVREDTARRVYEAAGRIGYHRTRLIEQRLHVDLPEYRFGFVLQKERQAFYQAFASEVEHAVRVAPEVRGHAVIEFAFSQAPADGAEILREIGGRVDVLAGTAVNHQYVTAAVTDLGAAGVPVFSLLSDFAQGVRTSYVGLNNLKMGRIAAYIIATAVHRPGKIAVFVGGHRWHGHELRETGFRSYFREFHPSLTVLDTFVNLETRQLTYEATLDLLGRHLDLRGIYVAGGGMEGAIAALREARAPGEVALVVNELTPESRAALSDRYLLMAIGTPLAALCRDLVALMAQAAAGDAALISGQHFLEPRIILPESL